MTNALQRAHRPTPITTALRSFLAASLQLINVNDTFQALLRSLKSTQVGTVFFAAQQDCADTLEFITSRVHAELEHDAQWQEESAPLLLTGRLHVSVRCTECPMVQRFVADRGGRPIFIVLNLVANPNQEPTSLPTLIDAQLRVQPYNIFNLHGLHHHGVAGGLTAERHLLAPAPFVLFRLERFNRRAPAQAVNALPVQLPLNISVPVTSGGEPHDVSLRSYTLAYVIVHLGHDGAGHYVAFTPSTARPDVWFCVDDQRVIEVNLRQPAAHFLAPYSYAHLLHTRCRLVLYRLAQ